MIISQRNGTSSVQLSATEVYTVDRFKNDTGSSFNMTADASQVTDHPIGFSNAIKIQCEGVSPPSGSHNGGISTVLEGLDVQEFGVVGATKDGDLLYQFELDVEETL